MTENKDILIDHLIEQYSKNYQLSDLHIRANQPLAIRENGEIVTRVTIFQNDHE